MLYIAIYFVSALAAYAFRASPRSGRSIYPFFLLFLIIFTAFRFEIGCDWTGYLNQYRYGSNFDIHDVISAVRDFLWWLLLREVGNIGLSYPWLNIVSAAVFFAGAHTLARRQPDRFAFLVFLFPILIINVAMSGLRQAIAIGILCCAYNAFIKKRVIWFAFLVVLASMFHSSAMVFLLLVPLVNGTYSRTRVALAALLAVPGLVFMLETGAGQVAISRYVVSDADAAGAVFRVGLLAISGMLFFVLLRRPWIQSAALDYRLMSIGALGMIALVALLPLSTVIADRLAYYLVPIQAVMFARIPFLPIARHRTLYLLIAYAVLGIVLAVWVSFSSHYQFCYTPYRTWIFGMPASRYGL